MKDLEAVTRKISPIMASIIREEHRQIAEVVRKDLYKNSKIWRMIIDGKFSK